MARCPDNTTAGRAVDAHHLHRSDPEGFGEGDQSAVFGPEGAPSCPLPTFPRFSRCHHDRRSARFDRRPNIDCDPSRDRQPRRGAPEGDGITLGTVDHCPDVRRIHGTVRGCPLGVEHRSRPQVDVGHATRVRTQCALTRSTRVAGCRHVGEPRSLCPCSSGDRLLHRHGRKWIGQWLHWVRFDDDGPVVRDRRRLIAGVDVEIGVEWDRGPEPHTTRTAVIEQASGVPALGSPRRTFEPAGHTQRHSGKRTSGLGLRRPAA